MLSSFGAVSATAAVTIDPDFAAPAFAHSMFDFWLQLVPPAPTTSLVSLTITDLFDISFVPGGGSGEAIVSVTAIRGPSQPVLFSDEFVFVSPGGMSVPHSLMVMPDEIMKIHMEAKANEFAQAGGIASAVADPTFQIDPNFPGADSFGFAVSPELVPGAIPEPATGLLILPLAGLFILLRHRRASAG
jgi:hypothetical protein